MLDEDKDGKLSKDEVLKLHAIQDADHDGFVTMEEIGKHIRSVHKHPAGPEAKAKKSAEGKKKAKAGKSMIEKSKSDKLAKQKGKPQPGKPHPGGRGPMMGRGGFIGRMGGGGPAGHPWMMPPHQMFGKVFKEVDADGNGSVTKEEIAEAVWKKASAADTDKNGSLTKEEIQKHIQAHLKKHGGPMSGREGRPSPGSRPGRPKRKPGRPDRKTPEKSPPKTTPEKAASEKAEADKSADPVASTPSLESGAQVNETSDAPVVADAAAPSAQENPAAATTPVAEEQSDVNLKQETAPEAPVQTGEQPAVDKATGNEPTANVPPATETPSEKGAEDAT